MQQLKELDRHFPEGLTWIGVGYLVSLATVLVLYFVLDVPFAEYIGICFFAWFGGFFARTLLDRRR